MSTVQSGAVSAATRNKLAEFKQKLEQKKKNYEELRLTPKRRASIIIQPKPQKKTQPGRLKHNELVRVNNYEYQIERDIGSGGSCVVYKARVHKGPEINQNREWVALKIVDLSNADRELKKIFENEIQFLEKLQSSPFVITMFDHQRVRDKLYVVLELGERNFKEQMKIFKEAGRLDESTLRYFWTQMLKCVNVIHDLNIVHADLKPANFVLVNSLLKLIDFGIAAQIVADETTVYRKGVQGTLNYISPEAVSFNPNGDGYDIPLKSDVWSLGCILYALVYGEPPFARIDKQEKKLLAIRHDPINFPSKSNSGTPVNEALLDVLKRCLTRDLSKRPSVQELLRHRYVTNLAE